ncbi:MAG: SAM-dependent chlorinase/fluorinase [bacterium]|nr:SAM-dependent chlorinase/fluorinase [bacterium]
MKKIITLTTDFGTRDGYVGAMKGRILSLCPDASIIDITHDIEPQSVLEAAWSLVRSTPTFSAGSIHVAVIDPGVGSERRPVALKANDQWYIGPDNGLFSEIVRKFGQQELFEISRKSSWWEAHASFDGLALFSPAAAILARDKKPGELGHPVQDLILLPELNPVKKGNQIIGKIIMFDHFGNAISSIGMEDPDISGSSKISIKCREYSFTFVNHYHEGKDLDGIAIFNSDNLLELSLFSGSAKKKFDLKTGDEIIATI